MTNINLNSNEKSKDSRFKNHYIIGRNPVLEYLNSDLKLDKILVSDSNKTGIISKIIAISKSKDVVVKYVNKKKLDFIAGNSGHQGIIAMVAEFDYSSVDDILQRSQDLNKPPFLIIADHIEDPHNLGAIIRTAECCGADGLIIPKRRSASLTSIISKTSGGAIAHLPVARVNNISDLITRLKQKGIWVYSCDMQGELFFKVDYSGPVALVIGSEGKGVSELVRKRSDFFVHVPMVGRINSLNASVAGSVVMYEIFKQRSFTL